MFLEKMYVKNHMSNKRDKICCWKERYLHDSIERGREGFFFFFCFLCYFKSLIFNLLIYYYLFWLCLVMGTSIPVLIGWVSERDELNYWPSLNSTFAVLHFTNFPSFTLLSLFTY